MPTAMSAPSDQLKKSTKQKRSGGPADNKPQSQINKCLNEKRRREQENTYIEELAELISASIADMSALSVKPDKCAILQETVNQIRRIKQEECIQQGDVSSSSSTSSILANEILCPLVLEALDGFLFVVNSDGRIEYVSENVDSFIHFSQADLKGSTIYNFMHVGDHAKFSSSLLPMCVPAWPSPPQQGTSSASPPAASRPSPPFNIRLLVKSSAAEQSYENMQISSILTPANNQAAAPSPFNLAPPLEDPCLVCIARRLPPNERSTAAAVEQFTTKLTNDGCVIGIDSFGVGPELKALLSNDALKGTLLQSWVHPADLPRLNAHLKECLSKQSATMSGSVRLKLGDKWVGVSSKSKHFRFPNQDQADFLMTTHSVLQSPPTPQSSPFSPGGGSPHPTLLSTLIKTPSPTNNDPNNNPSSPGNGAEFATFSLHAAPDYNDYVTEFQWPVELEEGAGQAQLSASPRPDLAATWGLEASGEESGDKLRMLLTNSKPTTPTTGENRILKGLLNASDDDGGQGGEKMLIKLLEAKPPPNNTELWNLLSADQEGARGYKRGLLLDEGVPQPPQKIKPGELCKKNPQLVHLLSRTMDPQSPVPQVPTSVISASPNERLRSIPIWSTPQQPPTTPSAPPQQTIARPPPQVAMTPSHQPPPPVYGAQNNASSLLPSDDLLDTILEQVIDIAPDVGNWQDATPSVTPQHTPIQAPAPPPVFPNSSSELSIINAIQRELMQYENNLQQQQSPFPSPQQPPLFIHKTTTTTTTVQRFPRQPHQLPPTNQQQQQPQFSLQQQQQLLMQRRRQQQQMLQAQLAQQQQQQRQPAMSLDTLLNQGPPNVSLQPQQRTFRPPTNNLNLIQQQQQQQWRQQQLLQQQQKQQQSSLQQAQNPLLNAQLGNFPTQQNPGNQQQVLLRPQQPQYTRLYGNQQQMEGQMDGFYRARGTLPGQLQQQQQQQTVQQIVPGSGTGSEFVRQELRTFVGARNQNPSPGQPPLSQQPLNQQVPVNQQCPDFDMLLGNSFSD